MVIKDIAKVLYAPHKVFKEVIQNPRYLGAFIVLILFAAAQTCFYYVGVSKSYSEQTLPAGDKDDIWTENATLWQATSGVVITNNYADYINGTPPPSRAVDYYGDSSIEFAVNNSNHIQIILKDLDGSVNCGAGGFKNISLRIKLVANDVKPENVSLYLLSDSNFFYYDLTNEFANSAVNVWNNLTLPVGSGDWLSSSAAASWENITSLKMDFTWPTNSSINLRLDGLFFRGVFKNPLEIYGTEYVIFNLALNALTPYILHWLLLTGLMYVMIKGLKGNALWRPLMVAVGFTLVTLVIQAVILAGAYSTVSNLYYPLEVLAVVPGEFNAASQVILNAIATVSMVGGIVQATVYVWTIALGAIVTHDITRNEKIAEQLGIGRATPNVAVTVNVTGFGWLKSLLVSGVSFTLTLLILSFLGV